MEIEMSNFPPGYSEDGDAASHGRDTAIYQELQAIIAAYDRWVLENQRDHPNDEFSEKTVKIQIELQELSKELDQPL